MDMMARRRAMMQARQASSGRLPSGYTEYEYIEATGTQYINTGYVPTNDTEIHAITMRTAVQSWQKWDWGVIGGPKVLTAGAYWSWGSANDKQASNYNPDTPYGPFVVKVNKNGVYDSLGTLRGNFGTLTWTEGNLPIFLFCGNYSGTADKFCKVRFYYWAAYENGTKMVEFIPALRRSDNELGLYETVSGTFFTNAGSGVFTGAALA